MRRIVVEYPRKYGKTAITSIWYGPDCRFSKTLAEAEAKAEMWLKERMEEDTQDGSKDALESA